MAVLLEPLVLFRSATKGFPSPRCASAIQIVRPFKNPPAPCNLVASFAKSTAVAEDDVGFAAANIVLGFSNGQGSQHH